MYLPQAQPLQRARIGRAGYGAIALIQRFRGRRGNPLSNAFGHLVETFDRIPRIGFIAGWFALALLLAGALVYVWNSIAA